MPETRRRCAEPAPADRKVDRLLLARVYWAQDDDRRALAALAAIAADEPERAAADELRADIHRAQGRRGEWERAGHHVHPPSGRHFRPTPYLRLDQFLDEATCRHLQAVAVAHHQDFVPSMVGTGVMDAERRQGLRLDHPDAAAAVRRRIRALLEPEVPRLLDLLAPWAGPVSKVECKMTACLRDGFFRPHRDDPQPGQPETSMDDRVVSFVAWFHREPARFTGGELVLHDTAAWRYSERFCTRFPPGAGALVAFPSATFHGVRPVGGDVTELADARLAITGHIRASRTTDPAT